MITNPTAVGRADIDAILARGRHPRIQFSEPVQQKGLLRTVNDLAAYYGDRLHVRFYGHYSNIFDAAVLAQLPDVQWLSVDSLALIRNERCIGEMPRLKKLSYGVYRFSDSDFLDSLPLERLNELAVWETDRNSLDLAPLSRARAIEHLVLAGHKRGIAAIASLPVLTHLELWRTPRSQDLAFLNEAPSLREFKLLLGGRSSLDELRHSDLASLTVAHVKGLVSIGPLDRFPRLRMVDVQKQGMVRSIDLAGSALEKLVIMDCGNLEAISGLTTQGQLRELRIARTKVSLDPLLREAWPPSLAVVGLYTTSQRWNAEARTILDAKGYKEYAHSEFGRTVM